MERRNGSERNFTSELLCISLISGVRFYVMVANMKIMKLGKIIRWLRIQLSLSDTKDLRV